MVKSVAIVCQGGGSHTAFTAGALQRILEEKDNKFEITALSGTSGGAVCALLTWYSLVENKIETGNEDKGKKEAIERLNGFWNRISASTPWERLMNFWSIELYRSPVSFKISPYAHEYYPLFYWYDFSQILHDTFRSNLKAYVKFDKIKKYFDDGRLRSDSIPELIIGATNVHSGNFKAFKSTKDAITVDMILASAAEPNFFKAVDVSGTTYWDGLFSRNPPISAILEGKEAREKPDEIWVIQIDPQKRKPDPKSFIEIEDRRNELSGNLSLEFELHFIDVLNYMIDKYFSGKSVERYKKIKHKQIEISSDYVDLDYASKWRLDPEFIHKMMNYGRKEAERGFLT